jgi:hypothetical protein
MTPEKLRYRGHCAILAVTVAGIFAVAYLTSGCATLRQIVEETVAAYESGRTNAPPPVVVTNAPPVPPPTPPPPPPQPPADPNAEPNPARPQDYAAGFLWKPSAEGGGSLVVLCPPAYTGHIAAFWLEVEGVRIETGTGAGVYNGGRYHIRYSKQGGQYPPFVTFVLVTDAGRVWRWKIPRPASRYDGTITPTVTP